MFFSVQNISTAYLRDVSFDLQDGQSMGIVGANGSGKSTLAKTLIGLERTTQGKLFLEDEDITTCAPHQRSQRGLAYILQHIPTYPHIKIGEYFALFTQDIIHSYFEIFSLSRAEYKDRYFDDNLSGGERKKIEIILTLHLDKKLYIFDEIEGHLDQQSLQGLLTLLQEKQQKGTSFLIISHHPLIQQLTTRSLLLCNGEVRMIDETPKVLQYEQKRCECCHHKPHT